MKFQIDLSADHPVAFPKVNAPIGYTIRGYMITVNRSHAGRMYSNEHERPESAVFDLPSLLAGRLEIVVTAVNVIDPSRELRSWIALGDESWTAWRESSPEAVR